MMFNEFDFMERFNQARQQGYMGVEILFPYAYHKEESGAALPRNNLELVLFNMPPGAFEEGDLGLACLPNRVSDSHESVHTTINYADGLHVRN